MKRMPLPAMLLTAVLHAEPAEPVVPKVPQPAEAHSQAAGGLAVDQDELSADVQQLAIEQTVPKVIELFNEVEALMDESTDRLDTSDTGGATIAAQTEVIEKIHAAAKERQNQGGSGISGSAMMDMMERMMGKSGEGKTGQKPSGSGGQGDQAGKGGQGGSDRPNSGSEGTAADGKSPERRVPKAAGTAGREIPPELRKAFDAYNRGSEAKLQSPATPSP